MGRGTQPDTERQRLDALRARVAQLNTHGVGGTIYHEHLARLDADLAGADEPDTEPETDSDTIEEEEVIDDGTGS